MSGNELITLDEYKKLNPRTQGYVCYMQAAWPGSEIQDSNPYLNGTEEHNEFNEGQFAAVLDVQGYN